MGELHKRICKKYGMSMAVKWNPNLAYAVLAFPADPANTRWTNCPSGMGVAIDGYPCSGEWISFSPRTLHPASQGNQTEFFTLYIACLAESVAFKRAFLPFFLRKHAFPEPAFRFSGSFFTIPALTALLSWRHSLVTVTRLSRANFFACQRRSRFAFSAPMVFFYFFLVSSSLQLHCQSWVCRSAQRETARNYAEQTHRTLLLEQRCGVLPVGR